MSPQQTSLADSWIQSALPLTCHAPCQCHRQTTHQLRTADVTLFAGSQIDFMLPLFHRPVSVSRHATESEMESELKKQVSAAGEETKRAQQEASKVREQAQQLITDLAAAHQRLTSSASTLEERDRCNPDLLLARHTQDKSYWTCSPCQLTVCTACGNRVRLAGCSSLHAVTRPLIGLKANGNLAKCKPAKKTPICSNQFWYRSKPVSDAGSWRR